MLGVRVKVRMGGVVRIVRNGGAVGANSGSGNGMGTCWQQWLGKGKVEGSTA